MSGKYTCMGEEASEESFHVMCLGHLKAAVSERCNETGKYVVDWSDDDSTITAGEMAAAFEDFEKRGFASPLEWLEDMLLADAAHSGLAGDIEWQFLENAPLSYKDFYLEGAGDLHADLEKAGFAGIDPNVEGILKKSMFNVDLVIEDLDGAEYEVNELSGWGLLKMRDASTREVVLSADLLDADALEFRILKNPKCAPPASKTLSQVGEESRSASQGAHAASNRAGKEQAKAKDTEERG